LSGIPHHQVAVDVADALPRIDRGQVRGLLGCGEPLGYGQVGSAAHADLAGAPLLLGEPLDEVVAVAALLAVPQDAVAVGVGHAADVGVADRVSLGTPVRRVGAFEFLQARDQLVVQPDDGEDAEHAGRGALALAVGAPRHDDGNLLRPCGTEDVDVDGDAVAQGDRRVLLEHDVDGQAAKWRGDLGARGKRAGARFEIAEDPVSVARLQRTGGHVHLVVVAHQTFLFFFGGGRRRSVPAQASRQC